MRLKDRVAMITGAGSGIGKGIAMRMAQEGADIIAMDINEDGIKDTASKVTSLDRKALTLLANVAIREEVEKAVQEALKVFDKIDILVNNAGIERSAVVTKMTDQVWNEVLDVNLKGVFHCTQAVAKKMIEKGYGKIINISSIAGKIGVFGGANYCAAKAGVIGITRVSALELARKNINVNAICPGPIDTPLLHNLPEKNRQEMLQVVPKGRVGTPLDIANLALFLASDEADYITGQAINCDGGWIMTA
jgi:3-oxoacyl-[acyl-carrier protein] reductase/2-hydroxycyclohexanecarboxyl-CoA dehydrogenase